MNFLSSWRKKGNTEGGRGRGTEPVRKEKRLEKRGPREPRWVGKKKRGIDRAQLVNKEGTLRAREK